MIFVPPLSPEPVGIEGLRRFARYLVGPGDSAGSPESLRSAVIRVGDVFRPPGDRALYLVSGKGGVGKSTAAAALAVLLAAEGRRVLLLGADPAGSLGDVLERPVGGEAQPVEGAAGLWARQLEAARSWEEFRAEYRDEAERIFGSLVSGGVSASADRAVVERLLDLAPPGIDELVALVEVVDAMEDRPYDALVLDTAPTGHFLRLLELPETALGWMHQVMRLLLKYREVVSPGDMAERVLALTRRLHRFQEWLRDPASTWTLVVALPEALGVPEAARLIRRLDELQIPIGGVLINRLLAAGQVPPGTRAAVATDLLALGTRSGEGAGVAAAEAVTPGPRGPQALLHFARGWRDLPRDPNGQQA